MSTQPPTLAGIALSDASPPPAPDAAGPLLYGRVVRPPLHDGAPLRLAGVDAASLAGVDGVLEVVTRGDFVAVVATAADIAAQAARRLKIRWAPAHPPRAATAPAAETVVHEHGDTAAALDGSANRLQRSYRWPTLPPAGDENAVATAHFAAGRLGVWANVRATRTLGLDIAALTGLPAAQIAIVPCADPQLACGRSPWTEHAAADAALLAHHLRQPVQVCLGAAELRWAAALTEGQENRIHAALGADGTLAAYRYTTLPPTQAPHSPALRLAGVASPTEEVALTATVLVPPYRSAGLRLASHAPRAEAGLHAGDASLAGQVFAHESFIDEAARAQGSDPVDYRLRHLDDQRGATLLRKVAGSATPTGEDDGLLRGRGVACAHVIDSDGLGGRDAWSAWLAEVAVDPRSGEISVSRVVVGNDIADTQTLDTPDLRAAIAATTGRLLADKAGGFDHWPAAATPEAAAHAVAVLGGAGELAAHTAPPGPLRNTQPQLAAGGATLLPAAAALANAIHDATGVRLDAPPFTAERIRLALEARDGKPPTGNSKRKLGWLGAAAAAAAGLVATAMPLRAPIAPITPPPADLYSLATLERGRLVAAAGDCAVCHTAADGVPNAGGLALETPFGTVYTTNITPDPETGIGNWSYAAFERAMREGIHRDGRHLYPAFPYTAFARMSDADMQALYAYLMAQTPVKAAAPKTELAFPYSLRPLLAGWNTLFHKNEVFQPDPARSAEWNRGAYLVEGAGHCGACHTPRNALGAEKGGEHRYGGGFAEGWEAPPLSALSHAPVPWTETELYAYLRHGYSPLHGVASGPMAPVVESLAALPDSDIRAISTYLASFQQKAPDGAASANYANSMQEAARKAAVTLAGPAEALYDGACAACHQDDGPALFGVKPALALNTNLHSPHADNLVQIILRGIQSPAHGELGYMPGFADSLDDRQVAELAAYLRARFAPDKPAWQDLDATVQRLRAAAH